MKKQNIYIGNIMIANNYTEHSIFDANINVDKILNNSYKFEYITYDKTKYKENAILLKIGDGYIDLDEINSILDLMLVTHDLLPNLIKYTKPSNEGELYIDEKSLVSFYSRYEMMDNPKTSLKTVKQKKLSRIKNRILS